MNQDEKNEAMRVLIKAMNAHSPDTINGAVILHMEKGTKKPLMFSQAMPADSTEELVAMLLAVRNGVDDLLTKIINLPQN